MNKSLHNSIRIIVVAAACVIIAVAAVILIAKGDGMEAADAEMIRKNRSFKGTSYIESQEAIPVAPIEEEIRSEEESVLRAARMKEIAENTPLIFETIKTTNTVLVGESRTSGFSAYGFLDENHVLGGIGWSIQEIPSLYDTIEALQPSNLIFSFGINELGRYLDSPVYYYAPEIYAGDLEKYINDIKERVPNVKIYINCIVPCTDAVYQEYPGYGQIPAWNEYLKDFCKQKGYGFIDISDLCAEHSDMYREDGTHLISDFYPYWGARILEEVLANE